MKILIEQQKYTSAKTSMKQIAALFKKVKWIPQTKNIDIGGGKYDLATEYLLNQDVLNFVFDPYNRSEEHNVEVLKQAPFDTATINNVLNVIYERSSQIDVLNLSKKLVKPNGKIYISIFPGDGSGIGKETVNGYQQNKKLPFYLDIVKEVFDDITIKNNMIIIQNTK